MGGPMAVYECAEHPWITHEIERIAARIVADRPTLGVCLGAQMIAAAMGAEVYPGPVKEIGFAPISLNEAGLASPLSHLADLPLLHWHGDTFDLPEGTELLASTSLYRRQAFRRGRNLLALQCHPEMGEDPRFHSWVDQWPACQAQAGTAPEILRRDHAAHGPAAVKAGRTMIAEWLSQLN
jgi:GMP synthase (glutamine-hydrolysing)